MFNRPIHPGALALVIGAGVTLGGAREASARITCSATQPVYFQGSSYVAGYYDYCSFASSMPIFDQTNPNLAHVSVPDSTYCSEDAPVLADSYFKNTDGTPGAVCTTATPPAALPATPPVEIFYKSWLPWGPLPGDPDHPHSTAWGSLTCFPAVESMALNAAIGARDPTTGIVTSCTAGNPKPCWVQTQFVQAQIPAFQEPWPSPLVTFSANTTFNDANAARRDWTRMDATALQQLANMAIAQRTDPTAGGGAGFWQTLTGNFVPAAGKQVLTHGTAQSTPQVMLNMFNQGYASLIGIHDYTVTVTRTSAAGVTPVVEKVTFSLNDGGHGLAVQGNATYTNLPQTPATTYGTFYLNDPFFGVRTVIAPPVLWAGKNVDPGTGNVRHVDLSPLGTQDDGSPITGAAVWPFVNDATPDPADFDLWSIPSPTGTATSATAVVTMIDGISSLLVP